MSACMKNKTIVDAKIIYCEHNEYGILNIVYNCQFVPLQTRTFSLPYALHKFAFRFRIEFNFDIKN